MTKQTDLIRDMILGVDTLVELENHTKVPAINLDNAATTPAFKHMIPILQHQLMNYSSIGRGTGQKSEYTSQIYANGRNTILDFFNADKSLYSAFYTSNTTDGMNKLASALVIHQDDMILSTRMEHHANDLPWRMRARTLYAEVDENGRLIIEDFERILKKYKKRIKYVTVTAASNVTGYVNDVHTIAKIAHSYGAKIIVDGAQIAAHRPFSMIGTTDDENIDFFVFSAHKMYAPFGGGAVLGLTDVLNKHICGVFGGGAIETVTDQNVYFTEAPDRYEAGSPNYLGVSLMLESIKTLTSIGFDYIQEHEKHLLSLAIKRLEKIPEVILYGDCKDYSDRVGILVFTINGIPNIDVAQKLAKLSAISVRHAAFCAHPYVRRLTNDSAINVDSFGLILPPEGLIRISFGIYNTEEEVETLIHTIKSIINSTNTYSDHSMKGSWLQESSRLPYDRC